MDNTRNDCIFKAAHLAGMLEQSKDIEVSEWEELQAIVTTTVDAYLDSEDGDFWNMIETALKEHFPPSIAE